MLYQFVLSPSFDNKSSAFLDSFSFLFYLFPSIHLPFIYLFAFMVADWFKSMRCAFKTKWFENWCELDDSGQFIEIPQFEPIVDSIRYSFLFSTLRLKFLGSLSGYEELWKKIKKITENKNEKKEIYQTNNVSDVISSLEPYREITSVLTLKLLKGYRFSHMAMHWQP